MSDVPCTCSGVALSPRPTPTLAARRRRRRGLAVPEAEEDLRPRRQRLVRQLALGAGLDHADPGLLRPALAEWNDRQAVLFDLGTRRFYIFPLVLYPQDFIYLTGC
jgi:hypothetical protein